MIRARSFLAIFGWPLAIFVTGLGGLIIALTGDGWPDRLAWAALSVPILTLLWAMRAKRR